MRKIIPFVSGFYDLVISSNFNSFSSRMKQRAFLFDRVGMINLAWSIKFREANSKKNPSDDNFAILNEIDWLQENGIVFEPKEYTFIPKDDDAEEILFHLKEFARSKDHTKKLIAFMADKAKILNDDKDGLAKLMTELFATTVASDAILSRIISLNPYYEKNNISAVPMLSYSEFKSETPRTKQTEVLQVVLGQLPLPDDNTPWEKIIDYRNDSDARDSLLSLRRWMRKISSEKMSQIEIEEELQWLMNKFRDHMKLHKIKFTTEMMESVIKAPLEIIEDLIKIRWSRIVNPFFAIKKRQIALMEAEINAPGKEIAYLVKTKDVFQDTENP